MPPPWLRPRPSETPPLEHAQDSVAAATPSNEQVDVTADTATFTTSSKWQRARAVAASSALGPEPLNSLKLRTVGTHFIDANNRQVILRGVNTGGGSKLPPYFPFEFDAQDKSGASFKQAAATYLDEVTSFGVNMLRVPFVWEALEPTPGEYDETYLGRLEYFVDEAKTRGLRILLDAHQDIFSRAYGGSGFPTWVTSKPKRAETARTENPYWGMHYSFDCDVRRDFARFWNNDDGIQDAFVDMWQQIAKRFGGKDNVIGFELINEPAPGNEPTRKWSEQTLTAFHEHLGRTLRQEAPNALLFFGVSAADAFAGKTAAQKPAGSGWVFAPHSYNTARFGLAYVGLSTLNRFLPRFNGTSALAGWAQTGAQWRTPVFIGEFGIPRESARSTEQIAGTYDGLDANGLSGAAWEYSTRNVDWNREGMSLRDPSGRSHAMLDTISRPYAASVAGRTRSFTWDAKSRKGRLTFDALAGRTSEIALPRGLAESGRLQVKLGGKTAAQWHYDATSQRLLITTSEAGLVDVVFGVQPT